MCGDHATPKDTSGGYDGIDAVLAKLDEIVRGGIKHGYFEIAVCGGDAKAGHTVVTIKAGKVFRFVVPKP
jgi:hypothetical protein